MNAFRFSGRQGCRSLGHQPSPSLQAVYIREIEVAGSWAVARCISAADKAAERTHYSCHSSTSSIQHYNPLVETWSFRHAGRFWCQMSCFLEPDSDVTALTALNRCLSTTEWYFLLFCHIRVWSWSMIHRVCHKVFSVECREADKIQVGEEISACHPEEFPTFSKFSTSHKVPIWSASVPNFWTNSWGSSHFRQSEWDEHCHREAAHPVERGR